MNKFLTIMRESSTARFFIPLGLFLIVFGIIMFVINTKNKNYIEIEATVSNIKVLEEAYTDANGDYVEATYSAEVIYNLDGYE